MFDGFPRRGSVNPVFSSCTSCGVDLRVLLIVIQSFGLYLKAEIYKFIWQSNVQTISQEKIARPKYLGGIGLFDIDLRQRASWIQEANEIVTNPNSEENLLRRGTLGPIPNLNKYFRDQEIKPIHINMTEISSDKNKYIRGYLKKCIPDEHSLRKIYQTLQEESTSISENKQQQYNLLSKIKLPKLWQYGCLTAHEAHKTRHWLYTRRFQIKDVIKSKGKCGECKLNDTQDHILEHCRKTATLRKYIQDTYGIDNMTALTGNHPNNIKILAYQKIALTHKVHINKGNTDRGNLITDYRNLLEEIEIIQE